MKKIYLAAFAALAAFGANAQFNAQSPYVDASVASEKQVFDVFVACDDVMQNLKNAGKTVNDYRVDDVTRWFYIWEGTFIAGDGSYPGVGYSGLSSEGYTSVTVANVGWSGAGYNVNKGAGINLSHWNDNTRFHLSYMSFGTAPEAVALIINDNDDFNKPARVALGSGYVDNGTVYPGVAAAPNDDWQAVDISFADLKKVCTDFDYQQTTEWTGNILSILCGPTSGRSLSLDAFYFYTAGDSAVEGVEEDAELIITANTVNSTVSGIELYDLSGKLVKASDNTVLGISDLAKGVYVVKAGNKTQKIVK
ncbi:MAG: T9SS type A sorting domain-containing protein [Muribaculaceae bacterium]|nr:T9SS type A sorting domain-containing protein [Muribaculaceae bacterium]